MVLTSTLLEGEVELLFDPEWPWFLATLAEELFLRNSFSNS
jgi:hypothetical protein